MTDKDTRPAEPTPDEENDTEGHSLQMAELGRTMQRDRTREIEQATRESRMRDEDSSKRRSFFRR